MTLVLIGKFVCAPLLTYEPSIGSKPLFGGQPDEIILASLYFTQSMSDKWLVHSIVIFFFLTNKKSPVNNLNHLFNATRFKLAYQ